MNVLGTITNATFLILANFKETSAECRYKIKLLADEANLLFCRTENRVQADPGEGLERGGNGQLRGAGPAGGTRFY